MNENKYYYDYYKAINDFIFWKNVELLNEQKIIKQEENDDS